jgi:uncharacterized protein YfaT (DUF1175 family)
LLLHTSPHVVGLLAQWVAPVAATMRGRRTWVVTIQRMFLRERARGLWRQREGRGVVRTLTNEPRRVCVCVSDSGVNETPQNLEF